MFTAKKNGADLSKISVLVKIIATEESKITNSIVKGTNSQNHVLPETFEITRDFHKKLEEFVSSYQNTFSPYEKIYYERRSGQYDGDKDIKKHRIFGLEVLTKSVLSCFFQRPHECVYHITKLLNLYKNSIFIDEQSMLPYYTSALVCLNFERLIKKGLINPKFDKFKYQIISLIGETVNNQVPDLLNKKVDSYCEQIIKIARNEELFLKIVMKCIYAFEGSVTKWIEKYGQEYHRAIKDNRNFTKFMLVNTRGGNVNKLSFEPSEQITKVGKVLFTKQDKNGLYYGFISAEPDNIFFHQKDNPKLDYDNIEGMFVTYEIGSNTKNGKDKALNINLK